MNLVTSEFETSDSLSGSLETFLLFRVRIRMKSLFKLLVTKSVATE